MIEIDVSEDGGVIYENIDGVLCRKNEEWHRPRWTAAQWEATLTKWRSELKWDQMLGAIDGGRLVGMASIRFRLTETMAQLTSLHVSRDYRRRGVATRLTQEMIRLARQGGAQDLYVLATPSESAIGFYLGWGFHPTEHVVKEAYDLELEYIHMTRAL